MRKRNSTSSRKSSVEERREVGGGDIRRIRNRSIRMRRQERRKR
jgi:hypothetical protein